MFNSIRKDDSCRKLVKSFEILRLQNKILIQAMSMSDTLFTRVEENVSDVVFFDNDNAKANNKIPLFLSTIPSKPITLKFPNEKPSMFEITDKINKTFYNYNRFTDLERCKSSFHLLAKKKAKAKLQSKALTKNAKTTLSQAIKKVSNKSVNTYYKNFSSSLFTLAKGCITSLPRNSSKSRIKNRCIETGRAHSVLKFCKLSRICLRDNASKALISGISKASW